jgi:hypothetical protein
MPNDNSTYATITPPKRNVSKSASSHHSKGTTPGTGPDTPSILRNKKKPPTDARLEPIRAMIESQPSAIQVTLNETALILLLATQTLRQKQAGILSLELNADLYPKASNLKAKLDYPKELANDEETLKNVKEWDEYIETTKKEMKKRIIKQATRTATFLHSARLELFHSRLTNIAEGYTTYHRKLEQANDEPLSNQAYGAAAVYCYYSTLPATNKLFLQYLHEEQDDTMLAYYKQYLKTTDGRQPLFAIAQLRELGSLAGPGDVTIELLHPETAAAPPASPPASPLREPTPAPPFRQPSQGATQTQADVVWIPPAGRTLSPAITRVIEKVQKILIELVPQLFLELASSREKETLLKKANAKLDAALKKSKTLDMSKEIQQALSTEPTVAPENMKTLMRGLLKEELKSERKKGEKQLLKDAMREARKKSSGGTKTAKSPPGKQQRGGKRNASSPSSTRPNKPPQKRAKRQQPLDPGTAYQQYRQHQQAPNPYRPRGVSFVPATTRFSPPGRGSFQGRGRGRGRSPGGFNSGRGRGRGRY